MIFKSKCGKYDINVDDEDYQRVVDFGYNGWEITYTTKSNNPYVRTRKTIDGKRKQYYLHRLIMDVLDAPLPHIDHKSNDTLDNRKENLRFVTRSQNMKNRTSSKSSTSKHLGVFYCKTKRGTKKYRTVIKHSDIKSKIHLGYYYDEESAGYAYNLAAKVIHEEYANLNKIDINRVINPNKIIKYINNVLNKYNLL